MSPPVRLDSNKAVVLHENVTALDWPTLADHGAAIAAMVPGHYAPSDVWLKVENIDDAAATLSSIVLAVHHDEGDTDWASAGLVTPDDVTIAAGGVVFLEAPVGAAALGDRWALVATVNGTTPHLTVTAIPVSHLGS